MSWTFIVEAATTFAAALALIAWLQWWSPRSKARRALRGMRESRLADVTDGELVRVTCTVAALEETVTSPISGRPCVGFHVCVDEGNAQGNEWRAVVVQSRYVPFK